MGVNEERKVLKDIISTKPLLSGLVDSDLFEILTTYVSNRGDAYKFEAERLTQDTRVSTAQSRSAILAAAGDENYIPRMPSPLKINGTIENKGKTIVRTPLRQALISGDDIDFIIDDFIDLSPGEIKNISFSQLKEETAFYTAQGKVFEEFIVSGLDENDRFTLFNFTVYVNGILWNNVQNFQNCTKNDRVYHNFYKHTDEFVIRFGNDLVGKKLKKDDQIKIITYHTLGEGGYILPDQDLFITGELKDLNKQDVQLELKTGSVIEKGLNQEDIESIRKSTSSKIIQGKIAARKEDYEFNIKKEFPLLPYVKTWGEQEMIRQNGHNLSYINKSFFCFLSQDASKVDAYKEKIIDLYESLIKPMNITPIYVPLKVNTFQLKVIGSIDRNFRIKDVEDEIKKKLFSKYGLGYNKTGNIIKHELRDLITKLGYFNDQQPHLHRISRPYFEIELTGTIIKDFFDEYIYLDAVNFANEDNSEPTLGYVTQG